MGTRLCLLAAYTGEREGGERKIIYISNGMFLVKEKREERKKGNS